MSQFQVRCPACDRRYRVPENTFGKTVRCHCRQRFVIPCEWKRATPAPQVPPIPAPVLLGKEEVEAAIGAAIAPLQAGINHLLDAATAPAQLPEELLVLRDRVIADNLLEDEFAALQAEKDRHEQQARELDCQLGETSSRLRKLENDLERAENVNTRRIDDYERLLECLLPNLVFVDGSMQFMFEELEDYRHVLRVLHQLQTDPQVLKFEDFKSAAGWREVSKHISSGKSNDVRVYARKITNGKAKYLVLVSKKGLQDRDKKRMQDAV